MAKFRCGVAPIQLELGRFFGQQESESLCPTCPQDVESECHVLMVCPTYNDLRTPLMDKAYDVLYNFSNMSVFDKFRAIMSQPSLQILCAKVCYQISAKR